MTRAVIKMFYESEDSELLATLYTNIDGYPESILAIIERALQKRDIGQIISSIANEVDGDPVLNISYIYHVYLQSKTVSVYSASWNNHGEVWRKDEGTLFEFKNNRLITVE